MRLVGAILIFASLILAGIAGVSFFTSKKAGVGLLSKGASLQDTGPTPRLFYDHVGASGPAVNPALSGTAPFGDGEKFTLEVAVVTSRSEALGIVEKMADQGVHAFFTPYDRHGKIYYRVRSGIFPSQSEAMQHSRELAVVKGMKTKLIKLQ